MHMNDVKMRKKIYIYIIYIDNVQGIMQNKFFYYNKIRINIMLFLSFFYGIRFYLTIY